MNGIFSNVKGLLIDLNGVVLEDGQPLAGARETIQHLKNKGIPCRFTTNTSTRPQASLLEKLQKLELPIENNEIISPATAAAMYLREQGSPSCHLLIREELKTEFSEFPLSHSNPDYVIIGDIGEHWNYKILNQAFQMVMYGARLIALHKGRYWQEANELRMDIGAFVAGLEYATGHEAMVIGKPSPSFFNLALSSMDLRADQTAMVGDDIDADVGGAQKTGMPGILVKTGKYRAAIADSSSVKPDAVLESFADLQKYF